MSPDPLRGAVSIAGAAESRLGEVGPGVSPLDLVAEATDAALADAGLRRDEIDGLFTTSAYFGMPAVNVGEALGIRPRYSDSTNLGGASFVSHLLHAAAAISAGLCDVALIVYASTQRSDGGRLRSVVEIDPLEAPYRPRYPVSMFALAAARHMHEYATTRGQLAEVAPITPGSVVQAGDRVGAILPSGVLRVIAEYPPPQAIGRIQVGQLARMRLEGFPWAQHGTVPARVTRVATEVRDGRVRVELEVLPNDLDIPLSNPVQAWNRG